MNKLAIKVLYVMYIFCLPILGNAQTPILTKVFYFSSSELTEDYKKMNQLSESYGCSGWYFNDHCWAMKDSYLQMGSTSGNSVLPGMLKTPVLNLDGNAVIFLRLKGHESIAGAYKLYLEGEGTILNNLSEYTTNINNESIFSIIIRNGGANTRLRIEGTSGKFYLHSINVMKTNEQLFHETFNNMIANSDFELTNILASNSQCDNVGTIISDIWKSSKCVYFPSSTSGSYTTPEIPLHLNRRYYLFFNLAKDNSGIDRPKLSINCVGANIIGFGTDTFTVPKSTYDTEISDKDNQIFKQYYALIEGIGTTQISFSGTRFFLDEIYLVPEIILIDENQNNSNIINSFANLCTVNLKRTLVSDYWNTLCLPFDITQNGFNTQTGTTAEFRTLRNVTNGVFHFEKVATDATIDAGTPFIVKVKKDVVNPQFSNVLIKNVEAKAVSDIEGNSYKFVGTFSPVNLTTDKTNLFLGTDGILHYPASESVSTMKGLRAYFVVPSGTVPSRVNINGEEMDAIGNIDVESNTDAAVYDLHGQRHHAGALHNGIYICNGRKVIVK